MLFGIYDLGPSFFISLVRSLVASHKLTGNAFACQVRVGAGQQLRIVKSRTAQVRLAGIVRVDGWCGEYSPSSITLDEGASLLISGDFSIGPGVHILVGHNARLAVGGRCTSNGSGITCKARVMVENSLTIGKDCIIAWDTYITDSNWHDIEGQQRSSPTFIGDNVWVSHGASVLMGSNIPRGCIVAAKSVVSRGNFIEESLIGGSPARTLKQGVRWTR